MYTHKFCAEDELKHYGVLGMKWGVRRARKYSGKADGYNSSSKTKLKKAVELSNRGKLKKAMDTAQDSAKDANKSYENSARNNTTISKHKAKYEKQLRRNEKRLDRATQKGDPEKITKAKTKGEKFIKDYASIWKDVKVSDLSKSKSRISDADNFLERTDRQYELRKKWE